MKINWFPFFLGALLLNSCTKDKNLSTLKLEGTVRAVKAVSEQEFWFASSNGVIGNTQNGGKTWLFDTILAKDQPLNFRSLEVTENSTFVASIGSPAYFLRKDKTNNYWDTVYKEIHPKAFYNCLKFYDNYNGIAVGDATDSCMSIVTTNDGGYSWIKKPCDSSIIVFEGEANFAASNTNISTIENHCWIATGGKQARIFYSYDFGKSFTNFKTPFTQGNTMTGIYSIDFFSKNLGFAIGGDWENKTENIGNKAITKDAGKTWQLVAEGQYPGYRSCVKFLTQNELLAVASNGISVSKNQGQTWQHLADSGFYAFDIASTNKLILGGKNKVVVAESHNYLTNKLLDKNANYLD